MPARVFVDTSILVYAYDRRSPAKQARAFDVLERLAAMGQGVLSAQVLAEFFWVTTTKLADPLRVEDAEHQVHVYLVTWSVTEITPLIVLEATRGVRAHRLAYWDAQLWATALLNQIPLILSEDFTDGRVIEGIQFLNPFSQRFQLAQLEGE
jgi:predicted nucleic acid-binding protein